MKTTQYSEALFQKQVITLLSACGYTVIEVGKSRGKTKCPSCNKYHYSTGWQGNTVCAPDLYIHKQEWHGIAIGIELKTPKGAVRRTTRTSKQKRSNHMQNIRRCSKYCYCYR